MSKGANESYFTVGHFPPSAVQIVGVLPTYLDKDKSSLDVKTNSEVVQ